MYNIRRANGPQACWIPSLRSLSSGLSIFSAISFSLQLRGGSQDLRQAHSDLANVIRSCMGATYFCYTSPVIFNIPHNPFYMNFMKIIENHSSFDPRKSSIFHISYKAKSLAKRQRMSKTSIISIFVSSSEPLESSDFLNCHKNIKGINKETLQRKNCHFTKDLKTQGNNNNFTSPNHY